MSKIYQKCQEMSKMSINVEYVETVKKNIKISKNVKNVQICEKKMSNVKKGQNYEN